jgi:hypothetical protein
MTVLAGGIRLKCAGFDRQVMGDKAITLLSASKNTSKKGVTFAKK